MMLSFEPLSQHEQKISLNDPGGQKIYFTPLLKRILNVLFTGAVKIICNSRNQVQDEGKFIHTTQRTALYSSASYRRFHNGRQNHISYEHSVFIPVAL
jgi:hypothetical protein